MNGHNNFNKLNITTDKNPFISQNLTKKSDAQIPFKSRILQETNNKMLTTSKSKLYIPINNKTRSVQALLQRLMVRKLRMHGLKI
jgi:hypothetical protein